MTNPKAGETVSKPLEKYSISRPIARFLCRQKWHFQTDGARWRH
ncbi:hypothetical protein [Sphingobacterium multivorum]